MRPRPISTERQGQRDQPRSPATRLPHPTAKAKRPRSWSAATPNKSRAKAISRCSTNLFADDFVDHTPQPGTTPDKAGVRVLYNRLRDAFPDFRPEIHWQTVDGDIVTTYKIYHGTHLGDFLGVAPTGEAIHFETVDAMRVRDGKITDHWGVANLYSVLQQLGQLPPT